MSDVKYLTREGIENLRRELQTLKTKGRAEMARQIQEAREKGDLSENAEYDAAKEAQGLLELKISQMEEALSKSRVLDQSKIDTSRVQVLCKVKIKNVKSGKEIKYHLVSEPEADVRNKKISVSSPIGKGLLGKTVGEVAEIQAPSGTMQFEVLEISVD